MEINTAPGPEAKKTTYRPFKGFGIETEVPAWAVTCLALVGIAAACLTVWFGIVAPHLQGDKESSVIQLKETAKHFLEKPAAQSPPYKDWRGEVDLSFYASDGCVLVTRKSSNPKLEASMTWLIDASQLPKSATTPPKFSSASSVSLVSEAQAQGRCYPAGGHPGQFRWWFGSSDGCWQQIWNQWPDGCTGWYARNNCYNNVGPFSWTACVH